MKKRLNAAVRASYSGKGHEHIHGSEHVDCLDCGEAIFNPICPPCLAEGFEEWIVKYKKLQKPVMVRVRKFLSNGKKFHGKSQRCVHCGRKNAYLDPYCFTDYLLKALKAAKASPAALGEFLMIFNFDFEHQGYYTEGEELGVF